MDTQFESISQVLQDAVLAAECRAPGLPRGAEVKAGEGHRSVVTIGDAITQETLLKACSRIPGVKFLCEEDSDDPRVLPKKDPQGILEGKSVVIDPLDGTVLYSNLFPNWTIGLGAIENGEITSGVICAPDANNSMTLVAEKGHDIRLKERGQWVPNIPGRDRETPPKKSVVLVGVDASLYTNITNLLPKITVNVRAKYDTGSGLYGLMMVALGRAQAVIQTPQKAWDWVQGYRAIIESGNVFRFFRLKGGDLIPAERYDYDAFCFDPEKRLGFVAGEPALSKKLFDLLPQKGWGRITPDTVSGTW